jgi:hypothetical protein
MVSMLVMATPMMHSASATGQGATPGNSESAGKVKSSQTRPGNPCLQGALGAAVLACAQNPGTCLGAKYRRIASRRGPQKASVAVQHAMLIAIWHMGTDSADGTSRSGRSHAGRWVANQSAISHTARSITAGSS